MFSVPNVYTKIVVIFYTFCLGYGFIDFVSEDAANEALQQIKETHPSFTIKFAKFLSMDSNLSGG
uniref:RRM domain-containing protein n=1 Tax=Schistosoma haematobium TaxID=6185 RepID=A0A094ZR18_SCHHA